MYTRDLNADELKAVLEKQYRCFVAGVDFKQYADGRPYIVVRFVDDRGANDDSAMVANQG